MTAWARLYRGRVADVRVTALVLAGLAAFVLVVYAVVVVGGGWLLGRTALPGVALAALATAVVALAFDRVQERLTDWAQQRFHAGQPSAFEVMRGFSGTVAGRYAAEDVPVEMARVLAEGTGAAWSEVWLSVSDRLELAATWPPDHAAPVDGSPGRRQLEVRHGTELLGVLVVQERPHVRLTAVEEHLFAGLAAQAGLALRAAGLRTTLEQRAAELALRVEELQLSRKRLVDAHDDERRLLERDIHDGAQQHLVALAVNLRLAQTLAGRDPARADSVLEQQESAASTAVDTLLQLTRGIFPSTLDQQGLTAALEAVAAASPMPVTVEVTDVDRLPPRVAAAAYFCCTEALQNAAKHAQASMVRVQLHAADGWLVLTVEDDGTGFDVGTTGPGAGLTNLRERLAALDGRLDLTSSPDGTRLVARIPLTEGA